MSSCELCRESGLRDILGLASFAKKNIEEALLLRLPRIVALGEGVLLLESLSAAAPVMVELDATREGGRELTGEVTGVSSVVDRRDGLSSLALRVPDLGVILGLRHVFMGVTRTPLTGGRADPGAVLSAFVGVVEAARRGVTEAACLRRKAELAAASTCADPVPGGLPDLLDISRLSTLITKVPILTY